MFSAEPGDNITYDTYVRVLQIQRSNGACK
jgi:hypothetical protein